MGTEKDPLRYHQYSDKIRNLKDLPRDQLEQLARELAEEWVMARSRATRSRALARAAGITEDTLNRLFSDESFANAVKEGKRRERASKQDSELAKWNALKAVPHKTQDSIRNEFDQLTSTGTSPKAARKSLADKHHVSTRTVERFTVRTGQRGRPSRKK